MNRFLLTLFCALLTISSSWAQETPSKSVPVRILERPLGPATHTGSASRASIERSDTVDVLHTTINLDMTDMANGQISGSCSVEFEAKLNGVDRLSLDLLALTVDSITMNGQPLTFGYDDTLISVQLPTVLNLGQQGMVTVHYHGAPQGDASGWGGFYFTGNYAWNLGVGFDAKPHNFGRVWYPCFDNFVERCTYDFNITTAGTKRASCNGELTGQTPLNGDTVVWHWTMNETIPTYLSCIAVGDYVTVDQVHAGQQGPIPIQLHAVASDTTNLKNSFINLGATIDAFETRFGPYAWNKVGYSLVPFNSGAMEHATNIAYPRSSANGNLSGERLMAHELAHMWFGDLVTCRTSEDMWLNEGWASFCELIFLEEVYGRDAYVEALREDLYSTVRFLHVDEDGFRAVSGVPHTYTYGGHVYTKGALVAHNLRGYMGDNDFFSGLQTYLNANQFSDVSSADFRDELELATGQDLDHFFTDWVFSPGWPHFAIDSFTVNQTPGPNEVTVYVQQKLHGAPNLFTDVPMEVRFLDGQGNATTVEMVCSDQYSTAQFSLPFVPVYADLNPNYLITHAVTDNVIEATQTGNVSTNYTQISNFNINTLSDSAWLRVQHHWVAADPVKDGANLSVRTSPDRYWSIQGFVPNDFSATARLTYDDNPASQLDPLLFQLENEDSLMLLYRPDPSFDWAEYPHYTKNVLNNVDDGFGVMDLSEVLLGEYCFGIKDPSVGLPEVTPAHPEVRVFPNPWSSYVMFDLREWGNEPVRVQVLDLMGRSLLDKQFNPQEVLTWQPDDVQSGTYVYLLSQSNTVARGTFVASFY